MERKRRKRRLSTPHIPQVNLTPMIDTVLVLLIVFMMVTPMMHNYLHIDLPKNNQQSGSSASHEQELGVAIDREGRVAINTDPVAEDELIGKVRNLIQTRNDKGVTVYADQEIAWRVVKKILDDINTIPEVTYVALAGEQRTTT